MKPSLTLALVFGVAILAAPLAAEGQGAPNVLDTRALEKTVLLLLAAILLFAIVLGFRRALGKPPDIPADELSAPARATREGAGPGAEKKGD
jgi:hypothetical protein